MKEKLTMGIGIGCLLILAIPIGVLILLATLIWNGMDVLLEQAKMREKQIMGGLLSSGILICRP